FSVSRKSGGDESHPRSQVAAVEQPSTKPTRSIDNDAVRVAEKEVCAHCAELFKCKEPQLVQPVVHEGSAGGLCGEHSDQTDQVPRNPGPQSSRNPSGSDQVRPLYAKGVLQDRALDAESLQYGGHDFHVAWIGALHLDVAAGDGGDHGPAS